MTTTVNAIDVNHMQLAYADPLNFFEATVEESPSTIVLQPNGALDQTTSAKFQEQLEDALDRVTDAVIVDLLWVNVTDACGIAALLAGTQRAAAMGKLLSFQSMDISTQIALESAWEHQREISFGPWSDVFNDDLECFLDQFTHG